MPIFRKVVTETSTAIFDIKADTREEADKAFDRKFRDPDMEGDYDKYRDIMNSQCKESFVDWTSWKNDEEYARSGIKAPDFFIEARKPEEPKYDIYFKFDDKIKGHIVKAYLDCHLNLVLEKLHEFNKDYILKPTLPTGEAIKNSMNHGTKLIYYVCERIK